jgi:DNA-binding GntR family transcriptional regulator
MTAGAGRGGTTARIGSNGQGAAVASQRIANRLRQDILAGVLAPGERIRQEEVAARHGASRLPVREALRILHAQGLVQLKANSGAWVSKLDLNECQAIYKMRERLEPFALSESIPRLDASVIERIEQLQDEIEANQDVDRFLALDRELHLLCYAGNPIPELTEMVERFWNTTQAYRRAFVRMTGPQRMWVVNAEHRLLIDAIRRRDTVDGERFLAGHIRRTRVSLAGHPELFDAGPQP